ncbi:MAG TPA: hypothetical protein VHR66_21245 [Gemmataceae bacterium]|jgi:hypothetical protein|nr:hypothetical protein [Gemmataceae bacterium]
MSNQPRAVRHKVRAAITAAAILTFGAVLPIWHALFVGPWEINGHYTDLKTAVVQLPASWRLGTEEFLDTQWWNGVLGLLLLAAASGAGWIMYRDKRQSKGVPDEARDYGDGPDGTIQDGRSERAPD